ncbi:hypothetical protein LCGC14_0924490 [marine sediment metagenome]|uniref:Uncharacterized protein n=1 Tax=marine sediment metagenome TaxID=412755 RepID=A0A0F9PAI5_9ZZZZ|nr:hypothetical protein [Methylophaga sp.]
MRLTYDLKLRTCIDSLTQEILEEFGLAADQSLKMRLIINDILWVGCAHPEWKEKFKFLEDEKDESVPELHYNDFKSGGE